MKKPGGGDAIEVGQWRCKESKNDSKAKKKVNKDASENKQEGPPFLVVPERRASKAPLPRRNTKEHDLPEPECLEVRVLSPHLPVVESAFSVIAPRITLHAVALDRTPARRDRRLGSLRGRVSVFVRRECVAHPWCCGDEG